MQVVREVVQLLEPLPPNLFVKWCRIVQDSHDVGATFCCAKPLKKINLVLTCLNKYCSKYVTVCLTSAGQNMIWANVWQVPFSYRRSAKKIKQCVGHTPLPSLFCTDGCTHNHLWGCCTVIFLHNMGSTWKNHEKCLIT